MRRIRSRLTFRAELFIRKRDDLSGLMVSDRYFVPEGEIRRRPLLWILGNTLVLFCLTAGLLRLVVTGFRVPAGTAFYPAVLAMCLAAAAFFGSEWCVKHWPLFSAAALIGWLAALTLKQDAFFFGARQFANLAVQRLNDTWSGSLPQVFAVPGAAQAQELLLLLLPPVIIWLSLAVLRIGSMAMMEVVLVPAVVGLLLCGAAGDMAGCFVLLTGVVVGTAFVRARRQKRMWGGGNRELYERNRTRYETVQKTSALVVLAAMLLLSVPAFWVFRPLLGVSLSPAKVLSGEIQTDALNRLMKLLPGLTAGQWNLNVQTVSGGVADGSLTTEGGYLLEGVEDLRLTLDRKPAESIFLRGYIGEKYEAGAWHTAPGNIFDGTAMNWNTDGSPRLYIHNLPFLRAGFAGGEAEPAQLYVERINANSAYTYVPYGTYLNSYYELEAGDGSVSGQTEQEDRFFFYFRGELEQVLQDWSEHGSTASVLDRVEESYRTFCNATCLAVPEFLSELQQEIEAVKAENKWSVPDDTSEITRWIRRYLADGFEWSLAGIEIPEGEDALEYFLFTSHKGSSVHFASAAVMLYRMFGIPARYVVGYEVPETLFTVRSGGVYTAVAEGDNSQAWAEIYLPGIGWSPRDMTPGVIGTLEEVGPSGVLVEAYMSEDREEAETEEASEDEILPEVPGEAAAEPEREKRFTSAQLLRLVMAALAAVMAASVLLAAAEKVCSSLGYNFLRRRTPEDRLLSVFRSVFRRAERLGLPKGTDSQSADFVQFLKETVAQRGGDGEKAAPAVADLYACVYGAKPAGEADIARMRAILRALRHRKKP